MKTWLYVKYSDDSFRGKRAIFLLQAQKVIVSQIYHTEGWVIPSGGIFQTFFKASLMKAKKAKYNISREPA